MTSLTFVDSACIDMIRAGTMRSNNTNGVLQPPSVGLWQAACFKKMVLFGRPQAEGTDRIIQYLERMLCYE